MNANQNAALAQADANLAALLTKCLLRPTVELASFVKSGALGEELAAIVGNHPDQEVADALASLDAFRTELAALEDDRARLALEVDYNRLFVGPSTIFAPPYESCYTTPVGDNGHGHLRGPAEREVHATYRTWGFDMPQEFVDYPDHIAVELDFLSALSALEARAWNEGDEDRALALQAAADEFRQRHLSRWLARWHDDVRKGAKGSFYPAVATIALRTMV